MFYRMLRLAACAAALLLAASCSTIITALLINELLNDQAPKRQWTGRVIDAVGDPVGGVLVQVRAEVEGDDNLLSFSDTTDIDGNYEIGFRWHGDVEYTVRVVSDTVVFAEQYIGQVELDDQVTDFVIQGALNSELSGVVTDAAGDPLQGVLVIGASTLSLSDDPAPLLSEEGGVQFDLTSDSGVYELNGSVSRYGIVCAYHPDHGFAYAYGEDTDLNGSIPLNIQLGAPGLHTVQVKVVDSALDPIANQVLPAERRFRLRLFQPFNLGAVIDEVVTDELLFPGLGGNPSEDHPATVTISALSTGDNGIAGISGEAIGGNYQLELLKVENDDPATALVVSDNPLVLAGDALVVVRVN